MKFTVITGPIASGKTTKVIELTQHLKKVWLDADRILFEVSLKSNCIGRKKHAFIIDDVHREFHLPSIKKALNTKLLLPHVFIIGERLKPSDFKSIPNIEFIDLKTTNAHAL